MRVRALRAIKKGEEVRSDMVTPIVKLHTHCPQLTQLYHDELLHRPDMSLMVYGFVPDTDKPLLPASDLPTYDPASPYEHTAPSDNEYSACLCACCIIRQCAAQSWVSTRTSWRG